MEEGKSGNPGTRTIVETIEVTGTQVIDQVKRLVQEGNVRRLRVSARDGHFSLDVPVTIGVLVGGAVALSAPWLALLGVIAGLVAHATIEVEREEPAAAEPPPAQPVEHEARP